MGQLDKMDVAFALAIFAILVGIVVPHLGSDPTPPTVEDATVTYCVDGDTCEFVELDRPVRLARIQAPELDSRCSAEARHIGTILQTALNQAQTVRIDAQELGHYDRWIAEVTLVNEDGSLINVSDRLMRLEWVVPYGSSEDPCRPWDDVEREAQSNDSWMEAPRG